MAPATIGAIMIGSTSKRDEDLPAGHALQEQQGHEQAENELGGQRDGSDDQRVQQSLPEARVPEQSEVVDDPVERGVLLGHGNVLEADDAAYRSAGTGRSAG